MTIEMPSAMRRRSLLTLGSTAAVTGLLSWPSPADTATNAILTTDQRPAPAEAAILGAGHPKTDVLAYSRIVPRPSRDDAAGGAVPIYGNQRA